MATCKDICIRLRGDPSFPGLPGIRFSIPVLAMHEINSRVGARPDQTDDVGEIGRVILAYKADDGLVIVQGKVVIDANGEQTLSEGTGFVQKTPGPKT